MLEWGSYLICVDSIVLVAHISFISWMMLSWTARVIAPRYLVRHKLDVFPRPPILKMESSRLRWGSNLNYAQVESPSEDRNVIPKLPPGPVPCTPVYFRGAHAHAAALYQLLTLCQWKEHDSTAWDHPLGEHEVLGRGVKVSQIANPTLIRMVPCSRHLLYSNSLFANETRL